MWCQYDILKDYKNPMPGEGAFYTDYLYNTQKSRDVGIEFIDWKQTLYPKLYEHKDNIIEVFNTHFKYRELGAETEERFQCMLQDRFFEICDKYNHAYKVTEENDVDKLGTGYTYDETRNRTVESMADATGTENRDNKYKDTPSSSTSTLNNPTNQTLDNRDNTAHSEQNDEQNDTIHQEKVQHDKEMVVELSELIDRYRQLDIEFVYEFENCFIGLIGVA